MSHIACGVIAVLRGQRHHAVIVNADHPHFGQIDNRDNTLDRAGIAIVLSACFEPAHRTDQTSTLFVRVAVIPGRPGITHDKACIFNPSQFQCSLNLDIRLDSILAFGEFIQRNRGLDSREMNIRFHFLID
jgi:hypothetical protein